MSEALDPSLKNLSECGCGDGVNAQLPAPIDNADGQDRIAYRIRTHASAKAAMTAGLSSAQRPKLRALSTRRSDDFALALIDGWAHVTDVLTFYQERLANEGYLRTATEQRSVRELARSIGYELDPGIAASTWLAFKIEDAVENAIILPGTQAQSVPGQDEEPQTFETTEAVVGRPAWNELRAESQRRWRPAAGDRVGWLQGTATQLRVGSQLLFLWQDEVRHPKQWLWDSQALTAVEPDYPSQRTVVRWATPLKPREGGTDWTAANRTQLIVELRQAEGSVFALRTKAGVFGNAAVNWRNLSRDVKRDYLDHEPHAWETREWPAWEIYAGTATSPDQPPREMRVPPTPKVVADAARETATRVARSSEAEVPASTVGLLGSGVSLLQAAAAKAKKDMDDTYGPASTVLRDALRDFLDVLSKFGLDTSSLTPSGILGVPTPFSFGINWLSLLLGIADPTNRGNPIDFTVPDMGLLKQKIVDEFDKLKGLGFALPSLPAITAQVDDIAKKLTALIANNPGFLPFNTLKHVAAILGGNDPADAGVKREVIAAAERSLEAAVAAAVTRAVSEAMGKTMKIALEPPEVLADPTPESVAHVARVTVKVAKFAALFAAAPGFGVRLANDVMRQAANRFRTDRDPYEAYRFIEGRLNGDLLTTVRSLANSGGWSAELSNLDDDDRVALAIVLCAAGFGAVALPAATEVGALLVAGGAALAAAGLAAGFVTFLTLGAAAPISLAFLLLAPGVLAVVLSIGVGTAMLTGVAASLGSVGLAVSVGPLLLRAAKRSERAVIQAVATALLPRRVPLPARLISARDRDAIDLDNAYPQAIAGGWAVVATPTVKRAFRIQSNTEVARAEFLLSNRVSRVRLEGEGLSGPYRLNSTVLQSLAEQKVPEPALEALRTLGVVQSATADQFLSALAAAGTADTPAQEVARLLQPHLRDLLILANRNPLADAVRDALVFLQSELLPRAEAPITTPVSGERLVLSNYPPIFPAGRRLIVSGTALTAADEPLGPASEIVTVENTAMENGRAVLDLASPGLRQRYAPGSIVVRGNAAPATHGETVREILGSGDATRPFQRFALKQKPLTYVRGGGLTPSESTLQIWVNDVRWREVASLHEQPPDARVYVLRGADDAPAAVVFGDGINGARLPTGTNNVRAVYRKGIGLGGMVRAGQLKTLLTRSYGLQDVSNPMAATGGDDPESFADARQNAPLTVRTLGRVVSLQDYEDYARAFPGVTKALATWTWDGRQKAVMLTLAVSTPAGETAGPAAFAEVGDSLLKSLRQVSDPYVRVTLKAHRPAWFTVRGTVRVKKDHDAAKVITAAREALDARFGFAARAFGQPVYLSEVVAALQHTEGIEFVDIDSLQRKDRIQLPNPARRLLADLPVGGVEAGVQAAELLLLDPASLLQIKVVS